ncbi:MAG: ATP-binding protein [Chloracidobacterium sp.]
MSTPSDLLTIYANALNAYLEQPADLASAQASLVANLIAAGLEHSAQLTAIHHQALAGLLAAGDLSPQDLALAADFLAALQASYEQSIEQAAVARTWRAVFDGLPLPLWLMSPDTRTITYGNPAALALYGYTADEWVGLDAHKLATTDTAEDWREYLASEPCVPKYANMPKASAIWRHQTKDGAPVSVHLSMVRLKLGSETACVVLVEDVFGRQQREEQFQRMQRLEAIGQLTSGVAHNFNNILSVIQGYAEMIGARSSQLDVRLAKQRAAILTAAKRGAELVRQLMIFSRKSDLVALAQDINPIIAEVVLLAERLLSARVTFTKIIHREPLYASVDAGQLSQSVLNLIVNARDAMPEGGTLTVATRLFTLTDANLQPAPGRIRACTLPPQPGNYALITVSDTGIGMSQETRQRLFEPFFTTKPSGKGTGLGLSTAYGCITGCGGFIEVESVLGGGTTFFLFLPIVEVSPDLLPKPSHAWRPSSRYTGLTALVVEDEADLLELVCEWLTDAGFMVLAAKTAEEALHQVAAQQGKPIHLLVTDDIVPEGGGQRVLDIVLKEHPNCRCVLMSGSFGARERSAELRAQAVFLSKPFSENELLHAVKQALTT